MDLCQELVTRLEAKLSNIQMHLSTPINSLCQRDLTGASKSTSSNVLESPVDPYTYHYSEFLSFVRYKRPESVFYSSVDEKVCLKISEFKAKFDLNYTVDNICNNSKYLNHAMNLGNISEAYLRSKIVNL